MGGVVGGNLGLEGKSDKWQGIQGLGQDRTCCARVPSMRLSARTLWLAAMNSGM